MSNSQATADIGRRLVSEAIRNRGAQVNELRVGNLILLDALHPSSQHLRARVKTRRSGTWHASIRDGDPNPVPAAVETFWIFVDIKRLAQAPKFYIVPDEWMRRDIYQKHQAYLDRHGGQRPVTPDSPHHAVRVSRIKQWKDRWDLLQL